MTKSSYSHRLMTVVAVLALGTVPRFSHAAMDDAAGISQVRSAFVQPPDDCRPWVYWTWLSGNLSKEGITADLEAMKRVGIGGALILDVDQGTPHGPIKFMAAQWKVMFHHAIAEAHRLGIEINVNNGAGYYGSGGSWVPPDKAMQTVVVSETAVHGGTPWTGLLPLPTKALEYRDVAVLAINEGPRSKYKIPDLIMKGLQWQSWVAYRGTQSAPLDATAPADAVIPLDHVVDITSHRTPDGTLTWNPPAGDWTIMRIGHAWNGHVVGPSPAGENGPETDKLDKAATDLHFKAFVSVLNDIAGPDGKGTLVATHIDSWEGGGQNWTARMRAEFQKRRGYDPLPYLPILTGRVLGDLQTSERFLWDLRKTVSELMIDNYSAEFQKLAHDAGLRNTFESYTTIGNDLDNANYVDEPMAEFWTPNGQGADFFPTVKSMSSAAHLNSRAVVGAESFTSGSSEKWLWHPAMIKHIGDEAFCQGINRFVFHRYASQRFLDPKPGMQMGPWGLHYERTNTWWEWTGPWHAYLTRCQYLLRQGSVVADVLNLTPDEPLLRFQILPLKGYDYDACGPDTFLRRASVKDGKIHFPNGRDYSLIVLTPHPTMSLPLLTHLRDLVRGGACLLGDPPRATPGLTDFPKADQQLTTMADELWGTTGEKDHVFGKGHVFRDLSVEETLATLRVAKDFTADLRLNWIHHTLGDTDFYFVANPADTSITARCHFRVAGKTPELWDAETGRMTSLPAYSTDSAGLTHLTLPFEPSGSAFIVFQPSAPSNDPVVSVTRDGVPLMDDAAMPATLPTAEGPVDFARKEIHRAGKYIFRSATGQERVQIVPVLGAPVQIAGPWSVEFPPGGGAPAKVQFDSLVSWSNYPDIGLKYFSGTATYTKTLTLAPVVAGHRVYLDLGKVQVMARVALNDQPLGILWKPPYRVDVTAAAKAGDNTLKVEVVNLWPNRLIGDEQLPEDSSRNNNGTLKSWPQWLLDGLPSPTGRLTFSSWRLWKKNDTLQESGLLGPITVSTVALLNPQ